MREDKELTTVQVETMTTDKSMVLHYPSKTNSKAGDRNRLRQQSNDRTYSK